MLRTWYFVAPTSKARDLYNLLHLPYTAMELSFVGIGALVAPEVHVDRLPATQVAYFLGLAVAAHALDQLEPQGSHYVERLTRRELAAMAGGGLSGALAIGAYYAVSVTPLLIPFMGVGVFFAFAYTLPSYVAHGIFHNNLSFALSWGFMPFLTSYFINSLSITPQSFLFAVPITLAAWVEIVLSRSARRARLDAMPTIRHQRPETLLKLLVLLVCALALGLGAIRLAR